MEYKSTVHIFVVQYEYTSLRSKYQISFIRIEITNNQSPAIYADFVSALILQTALIFTIL